MPQPQQQQQEPLLENKDNDKLSEELPVCSKAVSIPKPHVHLLSVGNVSVEQKKPAQWNTRNLGLRLGADVTSAASASVLIAPIITVIDRSIVEKAANGASFSSCLWRSLRPAITRPHAFIFSRPFLLIFALYLSTYTTANAVDTLHSTVASKPASTVSSGATKFIATSSVNMSACVYKDSCFARMFGAASSSTGATVPRLSYALFAVRDSLTIFASFNLPSIIAPQLANLPLEVRSRFSRILSTESGRMNTAQFMAPAAIQLISTPIHLLGLDLYNRQGRLGSGARYSRVVRDWGVSAFARMGRIIPAFGVGGVVNANMRRNFMTKIEEL
ncbi:putative membrane protein [Fonsecaea pedrosoi]|nr:putative membrane protein [Fonsecaea pedrosoi]